MALSAVFTANAEERFREMRYAKPYYIERSGAAWMKTGRIVGFIRNPNKDFTVEIYRSNKLVAVFKAPGTMNVYMSKMLPSGVYKVVFKSSGYANCIVKRVRVKPRHDCFLDIVMGTKVYINP